MVKTERKKIGDHEYTVIQLPPTKAFPIGTKILKMLAPGVSKISGEMVDEIRAKGISADVSKVLPVLAGILETADGDELLELMKTVLCSGYVKQDSKDIRDLDECFADCPMDMFAVTKYAITVNFERFFQGSGNFAKLLTRFGSSPQTSESKAPEESPEA